MVTVSDSIIQRRLGVLTPNLQNEVRQRIRALFSV